MANPTEGKKVFCSFCGESGEVRPLIIVNESNDATICNECITKCVITLNDYVVQIHPHLRQQEKG